MCGASQRHADAQSSRTLEAQYPSTALKSDGSIDLRALSVQWMASAPSGGREQPPTMDIKAIAASNMLPTMDLTGP